jgi:hypothetical protein
MTFLAVIRHESRMILMNRAGRSVGLLEVAIGYAQFRSRAGVGTAAPGYRAVPRAGLDAIVGWGLGVVG